jgi:hypothetical protein
MKAAELNALQRTLRACPFCSRSAKLAPMPGASGWWRVRCEWSDCGGTTWAVQGPAEAAEVWNRRPPNGEA